jgi:Transcriptional regulators
MKPLCALLRSVSPPLIPRPVEATPFKHQQVEAKIRQLAQTLPVGARLPAERSLAMSFDCNFLTVRRALKALVDDGTVVRRIGSGTFVARHAAPVRSQGRDSSEPRLGVLVYRNSDAYAYRVLQAVAHAGLDKGVDLRSSWVSNFGEEALTQAKRLANEGCVALVLPWFPYAEVDAVREFVQRSPLPACLPMAIPGLERHCFMEPARFGGATQRATDALCSYFQALGISNIAFLGPDSATDTILQKALSAYACRVSRDGMASICGLVQPGAQSMDLLADRWKNHIGDLAIISYDDEHALRFMTAMHKRGLSAPRDFRIVGFNNTEASAFSDPPLSTIAQNFDDISEWLINNALALARGQVSQSPGCPTSRLIVRGTCGGLSVLDDAFRARLPSLEFHVESRGSPEPEALDSASLLQQSAGR